MNLEILIQYALPAQKLIANIVLDAIFSVVFNALLGMILLIRIVLRAAQSTSTRKIMCAMIA